MGYVLVIDDSVSVCLGIEQALVKRGVVIKSERLGESARVAITREVPDLIICDVVLPDVDGLELCAEFRKTPATANIPIVIISGLVDEDLRRQAKDVGAADLLEKPFDENDLYTRVNELLLANKRSPATAPTAQSDGPSRPLEIASIAALEELLKPFWTIAEWQTSAIMDAQGQVLFSTGVSLASDWAVALAQTASTASRLAKHSKQDTWRSLVIESDTGITLLSNLAGEQALVVVLGHNAGLGMARWLTKKLLPSLEDLAVPHSPATA